MRMTYVLTLILILAQILKNVNKENEEPGWARIKFITYSIVEIHMICEACFEYPIYNIVWLHMYSQFVWWCLSVHIYIRYMYCDRIAVEAFIFIFYSILYKQPYTYIHTFKTEWIHTHYTANVNYNSNIGYWLYIGPLTSIQQSLPLKIHGWWNDCPCTSGLSPVKSSLASRFSINKCPGCFIVGSQWPCQHHCLHHSSTPPRTTAGLEFGHCLATHPCFYNVQQPEFPILQTSHCRPCFVIGWVALIRERSLRSPPRFTPLIVCSLHILLQLKKLDITHSNRKGCNFGGCWSFHNFLGPY